MLLQGGITKYIPLSKASSWKRKPNWKYPVNKDVQLLIKNKHRLWTRFQKTKNKNTENEYKRVRNIVRRECRKNIKREQQAVAQDCKENPKKFWQFVSSKTSSRNSVGNIKTVDANGDEVLLVDDTDKSIAFVDYFSKVYTVEPVGNFGQLTLLNPSIVMESLLISESDVCGKLLQLKVGKSPGPDFIHSRVLKETARQISGAFKYIFELSLKISNIPDDWKCSVVCVIH